MAGGSNGYRAALVRRQHTLVLISSLPGTAGLPPFVSFSTSYGELDSAVRRPIRIGKRRLEQKLNSDLRDPRRGSFYDLAECRIIEVSVD
jgi:hypothetical protein